MGFPLCVKGDAVLFSSQIVSNLLNRWVAVHCVIQGAELCEIYAPVRLRSHSKSITKIRTVLKANAAKHEIWILR
jgi:hypothetical protein